MLIQRFLGTKKKKKVLDSQQQGAFLFSVFGLVWKEGSPSACPPRKPSLPWRHQLPGSSSPRLKQAGEISRKSQHYGMPPQQFPKEGAGPQQQPCLGRDGPVQLSQRSGAQCPSPSPPGSLPRPVGSCVTWGLRQSCVAHTGPGGGVAD